MPRPSKKRRICSEPVCSSFHPDTPTKECDVVLSLDEYTAVRLIDLEGLSQEDCAERMDVARTTAQLIYNTARKKIAEMLVQGKGLKIEGGNYFLCEGSVHCTSCGHSKNECCCTQD